MFGWLRTRHPSPASPSAAPPGTADCLVQLYGPEVALRLAHEQADRMAVLAADIARQHPDAAGSANIFGLHRARWATRDEETCATALREKRPKAWAP
jgi:hypothetical protein